MAARVLELLVIKGLISTVFASYLQQGQQYYQVPRQQYYQIPSTPAHPTVNPHPVSSYVPPTPSVYQSTVSSLYNDLSSYSTATPSISSYKPPVTPPLLPSKISQLTPPTKPKASPTLPTKGFDSNVLNNLAIALQLLIVSNLLNSPIAESINFPNMRNAIQQTQNINQSPNLPSTWVTSNEPLSQSYLTHATPEYKAYFETNPYEQSSTQNSYPNANYLGASSNLGGLLSSYAAPPASPRQGFKLQSPYDALASGSFSEHLPSSLFEHNERGLQSPYAAILATDNSKDLFAMDFY